MINVFFDMDRVMVDIEAGFMQKFGVTGNDLSTNEWWTKVRSDDKFFFDLPPNKELHRLLSYAHTLRMIMGIKAFALTACPNKDYIEVAKQKRYWIDKHVGKWMMMIPSPSAEKKVAFIQNKGDILIDDKKETLAAWEEAGGKGFYYDCKNANFTEVGTAILDYVESLHD